jgi:hypothetical protein
LDKGANDGRVVEGMRRCVHVGDTAQPTERVCELRTCYRFRIQGVLETNLFLGARKFRKCCGGDDSAPEQVALRDGRLS